ncbi:MAG: hypothetical protein KKH98_09235 [Spirochaetes bacterium]|nr:hypothetical protein [Spirochaetota bacterium]
MKSIIIFVFSLIMNFSLFGDTNFNIGEPKVPEVKITGETAENGSFKTGKNEPEKETQRYVFNVSVIFKDNTILTGITSFPERSLSVKHKNKGFIFEKVIKWEDVKSLKLLEWKPRLMSKNTNNSALLYYFYPSKYQFIMKKDKSYEYNRNIPYLNSLLLTNDDGSTQIYSFFVDYWKVTGKNTGFWKNSASSYFYYPFKIPHKKNFIIINFR